MAGPRIPVYDRPMVQDRGAPNIRVAMDAPSAAFGGGTAQTLESAGRALSMTADVFAKAKQDADTTFAQSKAIELKNFKNKLLNDPNGGALYTRGSNSFSVTDKTTADFDKFADELEASANNDDQRQMIRQVRATYRSQMEEDLMKHVGKESQAFKDETNKAGIQAAADEALTNFKDPQKVALNLQEVEAYALTRASDQGMDGTTTRNYVKAEKSKILSSIVERNLNSGDDLAASEFFKANKDQFTGDDASKLERVLEEGSIRGESQRLTDRIMGAGLGPQAALEEARKVENPKLRDELVRRVKDEFQNRDFVRRQNEETRSVGIANLLDRTKNFDSIPAATVADMTDSERSKWRTYANNLASGKEIPPNSAEYYNLKLMAGNPDTRNKFLQLNLRDYVTSVNGSQLSELIKDQADARSGKDQTAKFDGFLSDMQIAQNSLKEIGIKADSEEGIAFMNSLDQRIAAKSQASGKKLTNEEIRAEANNLTVEVVTDKGWLWNTRKRAYELTPEDRIQEIETKRIPFGERKKIEEVLKRAGKPVTDSNIQFLYTMKIGSGRGN